MPGRFYADNAMDATKSCERADTGHRMECIYALPVCGSTRPLVGGRCKAGKVILHGKKIGGNHAVMHGIEGRCRPETATGVALMPVLPVRRMHAVCRLR